MTVPNNILRERKKRNGQDHSLQCDKGTGTFDVSRVCHNVSRVCHNQELDKSPKLRIIINRGHCDKRLAQCKQVQISKANANRHLAEWRFSLCVLLTIIVTVKGPIWKVKRISSPPFGMVWLTACRMCSTLYVELYQTNR